MALDVYYFDGHLGISDPDSAWSNDSNAFNGNLNDFATTPTNGDSNINYLLGEGTTAPGSGGEITQVRARVYGQSQGLTLRAYIYTKNQTEHLGTPNRSGTPDWSSYVALSVPSGGWTWDKLQNLEVFIADSEILASTRVYKVEVEVTHEPPTEQRYLKLQNGRLLLQQSGRGLIL